MADRLNRFVHELDDMPMAEYNGWLAYLDILKEKS